MHHPAPSRRRRELALALVRAVDADGPRACACLVATACDEDGDALHVLLVRALSSLVGPGPDGSLDEGAGWRGLVLDVHTRAVRLARRHPVAWAAATGAAPSVQEWVGSAGWRQALGRALREAGSDDAQVAAAERVLALHLLSLPAVDADPAALTADGSHGPVGYPAVARLRPHLLRAPDDGRGSLADVLSSLARLVPGPPTR